MARGADHLPLAMSVTPRMTASGLAYMPLGAKGLSGFSSFCVACTDAGRGREQDAEALYCIEGQPAERRLALLHRTPLRRKTR